MSWQSQLDPRSKEAIRQKASIEALKRRTAALQDPAIAARIDQINQRAPWLKPEQQLALAKANASDEAVDRAAEYQGKAAVDETQEPTKFMQGVGRVARFGISGLALAARGAKKALDIVPGALEAATSAGNLIYDNVIDPAKPVTRYGFATLDAIPETIQNVSSLFVGTDSKRKDLGGLWNSLSIATLLDNPELQGEGFVVGDDFRAEQARRARDFRGEVNGSGFTIGRGAANIFFTPNSETYRTVSGLIDAIVNVAAPDPTKILSKGLRTVARSAAEVPLLAKADVDAFRLALRSEAGITDNIAGGSIDLNKWNRFMDEAPSARAMVDELVEADDSLYIMEEVFKYDISPDMAYSLANAKSRDEVKAVLTEGWVPGEGTLSTSIYDYRNPIKTTFERAPLINSLRKSRFMRAIPEGYVVVNGNRFDRTKAVRNMINSARAAGANQDEIRKLSDTIIPAFRSGSTADDQYAAYSAYEETVKLILRKNGVAESVIQRVISKPRAEMDKMRKYMVDRAGIETDHGTLNVMADLLKFDLPREMYDDFLERAGHLGDEVRIARPMQIVELLNRVQTLPDPRELRRLTRNSFFADLLAKEDGGTMFKKGGPLGLFTTSRRRKTEVEVITDQKEYDRLTDEIQKLRTSAGGNITESMRRKIEDLADERDDLITIKEEKVLTGEQRVVYEAIDTLQNLIWKPLALATAGYAVRNSIDAQIRMHFGANVGIYHPGQYISMVFGGAKKRSILGEDLTGKDLTTIRKEHKEFLSSSKRKQNLDVTFDADHMRKTGAWATFSRGDVDGMKYHTDGIIQQGRLAFSDPLQSQAARSLALGKSEDEIVEELLGVARSKDVYDELKGIYKRGVSFVDVNGTRVQSPPIDFDAMDPARVDDYLRSHIRSIVLGNVNTNTGNLTETQIMFGFNRVPVMEETSVMSAADVSLVTPGDLKAGSVVSFKGSMGVTQEGLVLRKSGDQLTVVPLRPGEAFDKVKGSKDARRMVRRLPLFSEDTGKGLPQYVAREVNQYLREDRGWFRAFEEQMDSLVDKVFVDLYNDKYVKVLEKGPTYRAFYYQTISENLNRLDSDSAKAVLSRLRNAAKEENMSVGDYIGDSKVAAKIEEIAKSGTKGKSTAEELDDYARFVALQKSKDLLYDASERNNLEDIMRVVAPFAGAWRDIVGTYVGLSATENVRMLRSFQRVYTGAKYADPDNDGRGFVYEDPQTGRLMFSFPFSPSISSLVQKAIPGGGPVVQSFLEAPLKQLSQGVNVLPALGPMAQIAASELIPDVPNYNSITEFLLPYGKKGPETAITGTIPGWAQKLVQALRADTNNTTTAYFNTFSETYRAKSASGEYDLSREDEQERLFQDAKWDARWLTMLRVLSQFVGPTAGTTEFIVDTKQGDVFVSEMMKEFYDMQDQDYDTAVPRFLDLYGEDMSLYVASKSESAVQGLETSREFGAWTQVNEDLIEKYPEVAAYFAPKGSEFNFTVWRRQLELGYRKNLTANEILKLAQERIGAAKYRQARRMFGANPNARQREILANYRERLHERYPGFPRFAEFVTNKFENNIAQLEELIGNPRVADSGVFAPLKDYLSKRKMYQESLGIKRFDSKKAARPRAELYAYGEQLARMYPEFDRIWGRLLAQEVDK